MLQSTIVNKVIVFSATSNTLAAATIFSKLAKKQKFDFFTLISTR